MSEVTQFVARFVSSLLRFTESREHLIDQILFVPDNGMGWFEGDLIITTTYALPLERDFAGPLDGVTPLDASSLLVNLPYDVRSRWLDLAEEALILAARVPPVPPTRTHDLLFAKATRRIGQLRQDRTPDPVHEDRDAGDTGSWYFFDETWSDRSGPFLTESAARRRLQVYASRLNEEAAPMTTATVPPGSTTPKEP